jgi:transcriptional regulator with GAF, ATPase, and Fis domain
VDDRLESTRTAVSPSEGTLRVLLLEDSEDDALLILRELRRQGFAPDWRRVENADETREALAEPWDLIVADYSMPGFTAREGLAFMHEMGLDLPFIIVSGAISDETAVAAMRAGAHDYIMKDNLARLGPAVSRELGDAEERRRRRLAEESVDVVLRLARERERNLERLHRLVQISERILSEDHVEGLLQAVAEGARDLTGSEIAVVGHAWGSERTPWAVVSREAGLAPCPDRPLGREHGGIYVQVIEEGRPLRLGVEQLTSHPSWWGLPEGHVPLAGLLAVPLRTGDRAADAVLMVSRSEKGDYTLEDENALMQLANLGSLGLRQMEARNEAERRAVAEEQHRRLSDALNEINLLVGSSLRQEDLLPGVMAESVRVLNAASSTLCLLEGGRWIIKSVEGLSPRLVGRVASPHQAPLLERVVSSGGIVTVEDTSCEPLFAHDLSEGASIGGCLAAPLVSGGAVTGVLSFDFWEPRVMSESEVDFVRKLAASVSLALENSRLYQVERGIAETLQESLLVIPERLRTVRFGHLYRSATEAAKVGGDFYDLFELEDGRVVMTIGDVSGHGVKGASVASFLRSLVRGYAAEHRSPADVLGGVNRTLIHAQGHDNFATIFLAILHPAEGRLLFCSAGHPPALVRKAGGEVVQLSSSSPIVGAFLDSEYHAGEAPFERGDLLLLYTDGLVEARREKEFFGESGLITLLAGAAGQTPEDLPEFVFSAVSEFTGGHFRDDLALLSAAIDVSPG